ncbi:MAG: signal recognition particle protein [Chlamydiota bacterium]|nr:signal recognition particle protein [Chlamydiota bacterium]
MFDQLTQRLHDAFRHLRGSDSLSEGNVKEVAREVRLALLDADVNYGVVKEIVRRIKEQAVGLKVKRGIQPKEAFLKIVHEALVDIMGGEPRDLVMRSSPAVILLCGLQGAGKTTQVGKLAKYLVGKKSSVMVAACDLARPAAIDQLEQLAQRVGIPCHVDRESGDPAAVAGQALARARREGIDILIVDSAGRLHIDEELMGELIAIREATQPDEILFVANGAMGQDAIQTASLFHEKMGISGHILTMLDGEARAGAALSIAEVTGAPLLFEGIGEGLEDLQPFHPQSMADRILGMGDMINLIRKTEEAVDEAHCAAMEKKLRESTFTYADFLGEMKKLKKLGSLQSLMKMLPKMGQKLPDISVTEREFKSQEAMILSMTPREREGLDDLTPWRRQRIARGSGRPLDEVNRTIKRFKQMKEMMKKMPKKMPSKEEALSFLRR